MNENYNDCHHRKTRRTFLYTLKSKTIAKLFLHKKPYTFQKARQFPLRFYLQKAIHLTLRDFYEFLKLAFIYKKHDTLRQVTFLYTKSQTLRKKQNNLRYVLYTKIRHFCVTRFFIEFLKFAEGGGDLLIKKQCTLRDIFISKNTALCVTFLYSKSLTLCVTF